VVARNPDRLARQWKIGVEVRQPLAQHRRVVNVQLRQKQRPQMVQLLVGNGPAHRHQLQLVHRQQPNRNL
jgi:hypothetical protein